MWTALTIRKVRWYDGEPGKTYVLTKSITLYGLQHGLKSWRIPNFLRKDAIDRIDRTVWCDVNNHCIMSFQ